jgi:hypothetical protein
MCRGAGKKPYLTAEQFREFLNKQQRDPRLNEILYPYASVKDAQRLIHMYETKGGMSSKGIVFFFCFFFVFCFFFGGGKVGEGG